MNSKHLALVIVAIVIGLALALWPRPSDNPEPPETPPAGNKLVADAQKALQAPLPTQTQVQAQITAEVETALAQRHPANPAASESAAPPWALLAPDDERRPNFALDPRVEVAEAVAVDRQVALLSPGESVRFALPGGQTAVVLVEQTRLLPNGDTGWSGHLQDYGNRYPVVFTAGATSAFATLTTPQGAYSMESVNGIGWLYKNPTEEALSAPGFVDQAAPPRR